MTKLMIYRQDDCWMVRSNDPQVLELFGTDELPTAFTARASADVVLREIRRLNPDATVTIAKF